MIHAPPKSTRTNTHVPYTTIFVSPAFGEKRRAPVRHDAEPACARRKAFWVLFRREKGLAGRRPVKVFVSIQCTRLDATCSPDREVHGERSNARSAEHTSELQSLMRLSYTVFCLIKTNTQPYRYKHKTKT